MWGNPYCLIGNSIKMYRFLYRGVIEMIMKNNKPKYKNGKRTKRIDQKS